MTASLLFLVGIGLTLITTFAVASYLRSSLHSILLELCGTGERAAFWVAFSNVTLILVPLIFAMQYTPCLREGSSATLELAAQLKWALAGMLLAVLVLGWVLSSYIRRQGGSAVASTPAPDSSNLA
jgi:hypothetical protein